MYNSFCEEKTPLLVTIRSLAMSGSDTITKSWLPSQIEYMSPYFLAQLSRASSGYHVRKGNEPESIVSSVQQNRRQKFRQTHDWQAPWAIGNPVSVLVNQNSTEKSVEQHDETGGRYESKSDNRSNEIRCDRRRLGVGTGDVGTVFTKHREAIRRRSHLECVEGQIFR